MKRIRLHLTALAALMPVVLLFCADNLWLCLAGLVYLVWLCIYVNDSETARRFVHRYYHEILRMENGL